MINIFPFSCQTLTGFSAALILLACSQGDAQQATRETAAAHQPADDIIARVGDQAIHFSELNTMLNSSAVVGLSLPALGTPQRDTVRIALLDKTVSANLIYLDAVRKGVDQDPDYRRAIERFRNSMLADAYIHDYMKRNAVVSEQELEAYIKASVKPGTEITDEIRTVLNAELMKSKREEQLTRLTNELREGADIKVYGTNIYPEDDAEREDDTPIAKYGSKTITWGEIKDSLIAVGNAAVKRDPTAMESDARLAYLQNQIDTRLLAQKAVEQGLDQAPGYLARYNEYAKTRLINLHRAQLAKEMDPDEAELKAYFEANRDRITMPEYRKVQMVMLDTEEQAEEIKRQVEAGEITIYQAAQDHSVAPDAAQNLGEIGWVAEGKLKPDLNKVVFGLEPGEIGGPVEAGGLWHIVLVQDVRDAENTSLEDERTRKLARRQYIHEKLDDYVVDLRKNVFDVVVYEDAIIRLAQQEADMVRELSEKGKSEGSITKKRVQELEQFIDSGSGAGPSGT